MSPAAAATATATTEQHHQQQTHTHKQTNWYGVTTPQQYQNHYTTTRLKSLVILFPRTRYPVSVIPRYRATLILSQISWHRRDKMNSGNDVSYVSDPASKQTNKRTNKRTNQQTNKRTNEQTNTNKRTNEQTNEQTNKQTDKQTNKQANKPTNT